MACVTHSESDAQVTLTLDSVPASLLGGSPCLLVHVPGKCWKGEIHSAQCWSEEPGCKPVEPGRNVTSACHKSPGRATRELPVFVGYRVPDFSSREQPFLFLGLLRLLVFEKAAWNKASRSHSPFLCFLFSALLLLQSR